MIGCCGFEMILTNSWNESTTGTGLPGSAKLPGQHRQTSVLVTPAARLTATLPQLRKSVDRLTSASRHPGLASWDNRRMPADQIAPYCGDCDRAHRGCEAQERHSGPSRRPEESRVPVVPTLMGTLGLHHTAKHRVMFWRHSRLRESTALPDLPLSFPNDRGRR